jgi:hypothetical protein
VARHLRLRDSLEQSHRLSPEDIDALRAAAAEPSAAARLWRRRTLRRRFDFQALARRGVWRRLTDPIDAWTGDRRVRAALDDAYRRYRAMRRSRSAAAHTDPHSVWMRRGEDQHALDQEFRDARPRLASLDVHVVDYPVPVVEIVPPVSLVLGEPYDVDNEVHFGLLRDGFRRLAALT